MGQTTGKQQEENIREKFQRDLVDIKNSTPDLNKLDQLYEEILQYGGDSCMDILKEIELMKRETLQHMRSMYGIQKAATNQKYIKLIENAEDVIENVKTTISRLKGRDYEEYIKTLVDQNNILLILMPHEVPKINERRLNTIKYISDLIQNLNEVKGIKPIRDEDKIIFLEKIARNATQLKSKVQQFKGSKLDEDYNQLQDEIMNLFGELAGVNSITDSKTEVMLKQTNKKIQEVLIMLDNKCEFVENIDSEGIILLRIKWANIHQQIENSDQAMYEHLKKGLDDIMKEAKIIGDDDFINNIQNSKMMLLGLQECFIKEKREKLDDFENKTNLNDLINKFDSKNTIEKNINEERRNKLNQLRELSDDLKAINVMINEFSGSQNDQSKLDNCLMQLIKDANNIDAGNDVEIEGAKEVFVSDVQKAMLELNKLLQDQNIGSVAETLKIFEVPIAKEKQELILNQIELKHVEINQNISNTIEDDIEVNLVNDEEKLFGRFNEHLNYFKSKDASE